MNKKECPNGEIIVSAKIIPCQEKPFRITVIDLHILPATKHVLTCLGSLQFLNTVLSKVCLIPNANSFILPLMQNLENLFCLLYEALNSNGK